MDDKIREAINHVKNSVLIEIPEDRKALKTLITLAEQWLKAGDELPEKMPCGGCLVCALTECSRWKYNEALDLCRPVVARKNAEIAERKEENRLLRAEVEVERSADWKGYAKNLERQLAEKEGKGNA